MNLIRKRIIHLLQELETTGKLPTKQTNNNFCIIKLVFKTDEFNKKCSSIGDFMKRLKNSKITLDNNVITNKEKQNNRQYFNSIIEDGGFYRFVYGNSFIELIVYMEVVNGLDYPIEKEIIKSRVSKIVNPIECNIEFNNKTLLDKTFRDISILDTGWNLFGNEYRSITIE